MNGGCGTRGSLLLQFDDSRPPRLGPSTPHTQVQYDRTGSSERTHRVESGRDERHERARAIRGPTSEHNGNATPFETYARTFRASGDGAVPLRVNGRVSLSHSGSIDAIRARRMNAFDSIPLDSTTRPRVTPERYGILRVNFRFRFDSTIFASSTFDFER